MGIVFTSVMKNGRHLRSIEERLSQCFKMVQIRGGLIQNVPKIRLKGFISLTKVSIIHFDYDHNILNQFYC